jgi:hypothetical protein
MDAPATDSLSGRTSPLKCGALHGAGIRLSRPPGHAEPGKPGATIRNGPPWSTGSDWSFMAKARRVSGAR